MRTFQKLVALIALSGMCMAAPAPSDGDPASKKSVRHHRHHAAKPAKRDEQAEKLRALKETVDQQQAAMQQMQQQVQQTQQQLQQTQQQLQQTQQTAQQADAKIATVETNSNLQVQRVQSDLSDVKTALNTTTQTVQKDEKKVTELEHPNSIAYKGVRLTPGGFVELTGLFRSRATLSDQATPFNAIPVGNQPNTKLTEFALTARDSRLALRADADAGTTKLAAYYEMDFLGTGPTSNPNQTTSYNPRLRQAWARAKFANGFTISGGQMWNLITLNRKGTDADNINLWIPNIIEAQYLVGYDWGRFAEVRISQAFGKSVSAAFELANPSYLSFGNSAAVAGLVSNGAGLNGNSLVNACTLSTPVAPATQGTLACTTTPTYSTNLAPDMIAKVSFDSKLGHFEIKALGRYFRDRVVPATATTGGHDNVKLGYGAGFGAIIPVLPKKVDFIAQGMFGKGISRYEDSGQVDFVVHSTPDHNMQTVQSYSLLAGIETHPTRKMEADVFFGDEYYYKSTYVNDAGTLSGYGAPTANNVGCFFEVASQAPAGSACTAQNRNLAHGSMVAYYDLYKGPHGTLRYGAQYEYLYRRTWAGVGGAPKGIENGIFTTMRYIFP